MHWTCVAPESANVVPASAVVVLLDRLQREPPALAALHFIGDLVPVQYVSLVEYGPQRAPHQLDGHAQSPQARSTTARCFSLYRAASFFRDDGVAAVAEKMAGTQDPAPRVDVFHYRQRDIPNRDWRGEIFVREKLAGRVSLIFPAAGQRAMVLNFYRHTSMGEFDANELARIRCAAPVIRAALQPRFAASQGASEDRVAGVASRLAGMSAALSPRERDVVSRIALGWSVDGIAQDLAIAPSTVMTLRKRAYVKLNVNSRMALAWALGGRGFPCPPEGTDAS